MNALNQLRRLTSGLLSLALVGSTCTTWLPNVAAASRRDSSVLQAEQSTGSIALTLNFGLPQRVEEVRDRDIQLTLTGNDKNITFSLKDGSATGADGLSVSVEARNTQGVPLTTEQQMGAYGAVISGLPKGTYTMKLEGKGYATCSTRVTLADYSQHVLMSTANGTFSLGDVNGDGVVNAADRNALDEQLGKTGQLDVYDLNGDGVVDITDLSYVNEMMGVTGKPEVTDTSAIVSAEVDQDAVTVTGGSVSDLFNDSETTVTLKPAEGKEELSIPITLEKPTEMSEISITSPSTDGAVQAGTALVVYEEDGQEKTMTVSFDSTAPDGTYAISRVAGQNVVTINLGQKVAVKKVTITVTKVEGQTGDKPQFATVTQIEFLKDIVSDNTPADTQVKNVTAVAGDGEVSLSWQAVNNVTGYTVKYGTAKGSLTQSIAVSTNKATVSGLKNNQTYYFQVMATNGDWTGVPSEVISAVPQPASAPGAPSNLVVEKADTALRLSWGSTKDATYYQVYYRVQGEAEFQAWGGNITATSAVITGLTNSTTYEVAVKAGNSKGLGPYSAIATGTPNKEGFDLPALPTDGRIDNGEITSIVMKDPSNVNRNLCPNFDVTTHLTDNDPNTYWIAATYSQPSEITYTFRTTHDMNYLLVVPYLDATYKNRIANYTVTLKGEDGQVLATYYRDGVNVTGRNYYILSFPETKGVKSVTVALGEKTGGPRVSVSEITNNIYSLALQAWDGSSMSLNTRLTQDGRWTDIFNKVAQGRPGTANNVFVQLGMYWQLHLAYDNASQPLAFYNQFFKLWKSGEYSGYTTDERVALIASKVADRDLTEFFTRWGMTLSDGVKSILDDYQKETRAIWYLNDAARNYRLESGSAASGTATVTASVEESEVTLTIQHTDASKILGYEIRRNGVAIAFTTGSTYTDNLGAANNRTYTYSVVPVDKLGNLGAEAKANEVRVAYDKTISDDLYTLVHDGDTVTITMKNGASVPVTGIKVTGTDLSGSYTVQVKASAGADWTDAKTGELSDNLVAYFTKPGAAESDTRIWTYDAAVVKITGIPESAQVELLDYPGDRVDFYEGAAVGVLKDNFQYGDREDEVIPAGTLVILGTYRGDPTYNYVSVEAVYNTTSEADEANGVTTITRAMNGYGLLFAEIPEDGAVSDTSDGFFLFVPDLEKEKELNAQSGVTDDYPLEIRVNFYRTNVPNTNQGGHITSETLWLSFPSEDELPSIELTGSAEN